MNLDQKTASLEAESELRRLTANCGKDQMADKEKAKDIIHALKIVGGMVAVIAGLFLVAYLVGEISQHFFK